MSESLIANGAFEASRLRDATGTLLERLKACGPLPAVLNYGDLSTKNVLVTKGAVLP